MPRGEGEGAERAPRLRVALRSTGTRSFRTRMKRGWWVLHHLECKMCGTRFKLNEFYPD